ncbi:MAG: nicotinamide mononucleotide transporter [Chitinophagaceae bacterium]|nr:nicotinamide mononucleotide transporter [Chitinophagaceae bacterium]
MQDILQQFISGMRATAWYEYVAVVFGIASVWFSRKENILVYPVGLINTITYVYLSLKGHLLGEASVNLYYTIMSIYGWILWSKKDSRKVRILHITRSSYKEWGGQAVFFSCFFIIIFFCLRFLKKEFAPGALPAADAFASATAFTGMWLMARKKLESWYWWIITNIASIPLYFSKGYVFTSFYYLVLLFLAFYGLLSWRKKLQAHVEENSHTGSRIDG